MTGTAAEVFSGLDTIIARIDTPQYEIIDGFIAVTKRNAANETGSIEASASGEFSITPAAAGGSLKSNIEAKQEQGGAQEETYTQLLMRIVGVNDVIAELRKILSAIDIRYLYIFLDDFSELPEEPMRILVDSLISPLTRWSEFIKFKIAAYPGRVYLGSLDKTKIE